MMARDLQTVAQTAGGALRGENAVFRRVLTDSRQIEPEALFVALAGERFDGHDFIAEAAAKGVAGALVSRPVDVALPQVVVPDTLAALGKFARAWRREFEGIVIGITGSNGKTTVKEMTGAIMSQLGACLVTQGNLNNHIGVPLTLCRLEPVQRCAVIEMGANHEGEIAHLAGLAEPDVGVVINAGPAHLEGFGGIDGVARGKGEMFAGARPARHRRDQRRRSFRGALAQARTRSGQHRDVRHARTRRRQRDGRAHAADCHGFATVFNLVTPQGNRRVELALAGEHNVMNALAAATAAMAAGASIDAVQRGLQSMRGVDGPARGEAGVAGRAADRRRLQRQSRVRRASGCARWPTSPASAGSCSAKWRNSARRARDCTPK
jgi:UDP-N-acetylmuramoyl-tripeptide--D-alanyl-D-alanine ligase